MGWTSLFYLIPVVAAIIVIYRYVKRRQYLENLRQQQEQQGSQYPAFPTPQGGFQTEAFAMAQPQHAPSGTSATGFGFDSSNYSSGFDSSKYGSGFDSSKYASDQNYDPISR